MAQRRPYPAALDGRLNQAADNAFNLMSPLLGRDDEQDVVAGCLWSTPKVRDVRGELAVKAFCLLASPIELEVEEELAIAHEKPSPAVGHRRRLLLPIRAADAVLTDPVIETHRRHVPRGQREIDEQLVGLEVMYEVVMAREGMLSPQHVGP
jgi:hypothetical protein